MFCFYVLSLFKNWDTIQEGTLYKGGGTLFKEIYARYLIPDMTFEGRSRQDTILRIEAVWAGLAFLSCRYIAAQKTIVGSQFHAYFCNSLIK